MTIRDNVNAVHKLLRKELHISHFPAYYFDGRAHIPNAVS